MMKSEKARHTVSSNTNNESTLYASSGIGQTIKDNSFYTSALGLKSNSIVSGHNASQNRLPPSIDKIKKKKINALKVKQEKENHSESRGFMKQRDAPMQNLFKSSSHLQPNNQNDSISNLSLNPMELSQDLKPKTGLLALSQDNQPQYRPQTAKNKTKTAFNSWQ